MENTTENEESVSNADSEIALEDSKFQYNREMTPEEKEAYGITPEIENFVKTGEDFEVQLPSQMENTTENEESVSNDFSDSEDTCFIPIGDGIEVKLPNDFKYYNTPVENRPGYKELIEHNDLKDLEDSRNIKVGQHLYNSMLGNLASDGTPPTGLFDPFVNLLPLIDAGRSIRSTIAAEDAQADTMREYLISKGHTADYTEEYRGTP